MKKLEANQENLNYLYERLMHTRGRPEFNRVIDQVAALTAHEAKLLCMAFTQGLKPRTKADAIFRIYTRHEVLVSQRARARATMGRSAA